MKWIKEQKQKRAEKALVKKEVLKRVDKWSKKIKTVKKDGEKQKYAVHTFSIGANQYKFFERQIPGIGIVVNPNYKITPEIPAAGGIPFKSGDLIFWKYHFGEERGWEVVRQLTNNEKTCLEVICQYGHFSSGDAAKKAKAEKEDHKMKMHLSFSDISSLREWLEKKWKENGEAEEKFSGWLKEYFASGHKITVNGKTYKYDACKELLKK